ncbi:MAG: type II secretion system protein [Sedimentisphaerales bacterium]|nr:type II secretion system protein [Sedimentisphaerales bacterium]
MMNARRACAFTLIELLVVVSIIALLVSILLPALNLARHKARCANCLINLRNMEIAHWMYMGEHNGCFVDVGLGHGGAHSDEKVAWINTLQPYYENKLLFRSPVDKSPHWPIDEEGQGVPVPGSDPPAWRRTSYGVNNYISHVAPDPEHICRRLNQVRSPADTVHFLIMAFEGEFAGADHPHVENWFLNPVPPHEAAKQVQINAYSGEAGTWEAQSGWGFLDGHAEKLPFKKVYHDYRINRFIPY